LIASLTTFLNDPRELEYFFFLKREKFTSQNCNEDNFHADA